MVTGSSGRNKKTTTGPLITALNVVEYPLSSVYGRMGIKFRTVVTISDSFRDILKRQRYEELVLTTINKSQTLIENRPLSRVTEQSNNEPDYLDTKGNKYDVKLLLDSKQGALIGERKNDLQQWIHSMMNECGEFNNCIRNRCIANVQNTQLYGSSLETVGKNLQYSRKNLINLQIAFIPRSIDNEPLCIWYSVSAGKPHEWAAARHSAYHMHTHCQ